jgi:ribosome-associated protein
VNDENQPSKTQLKKQMSDLQNLGAELVELSEDRLASLALPESLLDAVLEARRVTKFEARRRQMQYIGKLMRHVDPEPIRTRLDAWNSVTRGHIALLQRSERWRDRLLSEADAITQFASEYPLTDLQQLRVLVLDTQREREMVKPPKNYRALFQFVRRIVDESRKDQDSPPLV